MAGVGAACGLALLSSCASSRPYRWSLALKHDAALRHHAEQIRIGRIEVQRETFGQLIADVQKRSVAQDPQGQGICFIVPPEFQHAYSSLREQRLTLTLGPNLTLEQFLSEVPLDGWVFFALSDHEVALIPQGQVVFDVEVPNAGSQRRIDPPRGATTDKR